jgi:MinD superfamily P-loop ATPase
LIETAPDGKGVALTLAIASGKGGTGKTLLATNLGALAADDGVRVVLADCDAEAPNDHLFSRYEEPATTVVESLFASVDAKTCSACGSCRDACAFGAVRVLGSSALVFEELCHGCGLCADVCPERAITEVPKRIGEVAVRRDTYRPGLTLATGTLDVGQVKTPTVIDAVREVAQSKASELLILDAPPGVACAAVAAIRGADVLLLVTEPTAFGHHDLRLGLELGRSLGLPMGVVVNRVGTGVVEIDSLCSSFDVPIVARIPFDRRIAEVYAGGGLVVTELPKIRDELSGIVRTMRAIAGGKVAAG